MKKILILGANGMAGHMIAMYLHSLGYYHLTLMAKNKIEYLKPSNCVELYSDIDVEEYGHLNKIFSLTNEQKYDIILNCVGLLVQDSKKSPARATYLNSYFPKVLAEHLGGAKLIHLSTDCVFKGNRPFGNYNEHDVPDETTPYGMSKIGGEIRDNPDVLTIRTSIIGPELKENGTGLFHWFMKQEGYTNGYKEVYWNGITTLELAKKIVTIIEDFKGGLVHCTPSYRLSKCCLLYVIARKFDKQITIGSVYDVTQDKTLCSVGGAYKFNFSDSYDTMLKELHDFMIDHKELYKQYL